MNKHWVLMLADEDPELTAERSFVKDIICHNKPSEKGIEKMMIKYDCKYAWVREEYVREK